MLKSNFSDIYYHKYNDLPLAKTLNIQNKAVLIKSVFKKNHYFYETF